MSIITGTVKIGRWTYPATKTTGGVVMRNTKRDGSGSWIECLGALFDADVAAAPTEPAKAAKAEAEPKPAKQLTAGKRTWLPGTQCPKGHTLTDKTRYVMPSGRVQCRECRSGYASNV